MQTVGDAVRQQHQQHRREHGNCRQHSRPAATIKRKGMNISHDNSAQKSCAPELASLYSRQAAPAPGARCSAFTRKAQAMCRYQVNGTGSTSCATTRMMTGGPVGRHAEPQDHARDLREQWPWSAARRQAPAGQSRQSN